MCVLRKRRGRRVEFGGDQTSGERVGLDRARPPWLKENWSEPSFPHYLSGLLTRAEIDYGAPSPPVLIVIELNLGDAVLVSSIISSLVGAWAHSKRRAMIFSACSPRT